MSMENFYHENPAYYCYPGPKSRDPTMMKPIYDRRSRNDRRSHPFTPLEFDRCNHDIEQFFCKNVPELIEQHQGLIDEQIAKLDDLNEDDDMRFSTETTVQELRDHLVTFENSVAELSRVHPWTVEEYKSLSKQLNREMARFKSRLPIYARRQKLIETISQNQVTILKADTGSGKSSQLVQYLADSGLVHYGQIVCSQPRRLAARELAARVAKEFGCPLGEEVGCHVSSCRARVSERTKIRFVTHAVLLNDYQRDRNLSAYSFIIVDEAHERRIDTDLLFGVLKLCLNYRQDLRLIIMSATFDEKLMSQYYNNACLIEVPGRIFPIEDIYAMADTENYVDAAIQKVLAIHASQVSGDILVFLTGPDEIDRAIDEVNRCIYPSGSAQILPLHGKLSEEDTQAVFVRRAGDQRRKIIFATNVAETSITIDGIRHVIDTGMVKEVMWDVRKKMQVLKIGYTTQSSIKQRRGRAGRTSPGTCYYMYTYDTYQTLDVCSRAEILCTQPSIAVLKLKFLNIVDDLENFDWLERPSTSTLQDAVQSLTWLGALNSRTGKLTDLGRRMAKLNLEPKICVMIMRAKELDCLSHILAITGMLSVVQNLWWYSKDDSSKQSYDEIRRSFVQPKDIGGDFMLLLRIFLDWYHADENGHHRKSWCFKHMIRWHAMKMANDFIRELMHQINPKTHIHFTELTDERMERIVSCICAGFFQNLAISNGPLRAGYQLATSTTNSVARIHRSSIMNIASQPARYVLYHEILNINETNILTTICPIELDRLNNSWLNSLPRSPSQRILESYTFVHVGPALLFSLAGKKHQKIPQLEEEFQIVFDFDYDDSRFTIWARPEHLSRAREHIEQILTREKQRLCNELEEFQINSSTRVLLGAGAEPRLVLVTDEYVKILLTNLPENITEEQIEQRCSSYGSVRYATMIRRTQQNSCAAVTFVDCEDAKKTVTRLAQEKWDGRQIFARPSYTCQSVDFRRQHYKLKAEWFLTECDGGGRMTFSNMKTAIQVYEYLIARDRFTCEIEMISVNPTMKCTWPMRPHHGHALVHFLTSEQAQVASEASYSTSFSIKPSQKSNKSLYIQGVPLEFDEDRLKSEFADCTHVTILRTKKNIKIFTPSTAGEYLRQIFQSYSSFQSESIFVEPVLSDGCAVAYVQFKDENEMKKALCEQGSKNSMFGFGKLNLKIPKQRSKPEVKRKREVQHDEFRIRFSNLPSYADESFLLQQLSLNFNRNHVMHTIVYRKKLPSNVISNGTQNIVDNKRARTVLQSLFANRKDFPSELQIEIRPPTEDGRVIAYIDFHDPREINAAAHFCNSLDNTTIQATGLTQLHFVPLLSHQIVFHETLAQLINDKIDKTINTIQSCSNFPNVLLFKNKRTKNDKTQIVISIRATSIEQLYQVRMYFDELLQGLKFQLQENSWSSILFDVRGQNFLAELQKRTHTYIWWRWKTTFLRIFGEDQACHDVHSRIETFIRERLAQSEHSIAVSDLTTENQQTTDSSSSLEARNTTQSTAEENAERVRIAREERRSIRNRTNQKKRIGTNNICEICTGTLESPYTLQQCGHTFCQPCLTSYFSTYFDTTISSDTFKVSCPFRNCNAVCLIRDIVSVIGIERMARLAMIAYQIYARRTDNNLAQCIGLDCKQVYRLSNDSSTFFCDQCVKFYCTTCETEFHPGMTCEQYRQIYKQKDEKAILDHNIGKLAIKHCPNCQTRIDKYTGCNAVICTMCGVHFCWLCLRPDENDIHDHFDDPTSPCYGKMMHTERREGQF